MVKSVTGSYMLEYQPLGADEPLKIDFTPPFKRIPIIEGLEEALGVKLPAADTFHTEETRVYFEKLLKEKVRHWFAMSGCFIVMRVILEIISFRFDVVSHRVRKCVTLTFCVSDVRDCAWLVTRMHLSRMFPVVRLGLPRSSVSGVLCFAYV